MGDIQLGILQHNLGEALKSGNLPHRLGWEDHGDDMPILKSARSLGLVVLALLIIQGCGYRKTMAFHSPSGKSAIEIWQTEIDNSWGARVNLVTPTRTMTIHEVRREAFLYFVHVYWSQDESKVAVVGRGFAGFNLALETNSLRTLPFDDLRSEVERSIRQTYDVPIGEDPLRWAAMTDAPRAFFKLHPEIHLTYHDK